MISLMPEILCPVCNQPITLDIGMCTCTKGHRYMIMKNIIDFLPNTNDESLKEEEQHWDRYATKGKASIEVNSYIKEKIYNDYDALFYEYITNEWPDHSQKHISVAEIGCGSGSAIRFLKQINFTEVDYVGIDLSLQSMTEFKGMKEILPNWKIRFVRASANTGLFSDSTLHMVFSTSALHHLRLTDVIKWTSKSLKRGGLFILNEPSELNPFAKLGRKFVRDFHTKGEKPLHPKKIRKIANEYGLQLRYEKGLHFLSGPMMYLVEILHLPMPFSILAYSVSKVFDGLIISPSWNYSFVQVYRRV
jgi:SAM-dependent methyltransferase